MSQETQNPDTYFDPRTPAGREAFIGDLNAMSGATDLLPDQSQREPDASNTDPRTPEGRSAFEVSLVRAAGVRSSTEPDGVGGQADWDAYAAGVDQLHDHEVGLTPNTQPNRRVRGISAILPPTQPVSQPVAKPTPRIAS